MEYLKYTPEMARDWKNAFNASKGYLKKRTLDSMNESQLVSKLWLTQELGNLNIKPINVALLAGWFAQYTVPLLYDNFKTIEWIENFDIDYDVAPLSYKFNKRYKEEKKYKFSIKNVMFNDPNSILKLSMEDEHIIFDTVINCSCEHMYPMSKFKELNVNNTLYVLQSTNDTQYDDHINCVNNVDELADQANLIDVMYSGEKLLPNGMTRFMVIGK